MDKRGTPKVIHLDDKIIRLISKQAIDSPQKNFKHYVEYLLTQQALTNALKSLIANNKEEGK